MGKLKGRDRRDKYYHLAKESRYRSRAAFKLMQLNSKFSFLTSSQSVLDLCAAPGGWLQVVVKKVPVGSLVIGVDIDPIRPVAGAISLQEDITTAKCKSTLKRIIAQKGCSGFDLILHDGSPNMGGAWAMEATMQNSLVIDSVKLAAQFLLPNGTFVTKVFRSQDYTAVLYCLRQLFEKVEVEKPLASRSESAEIYVIGFKYKAPAKIDPRLLDIKHLFQGGKEPLKVVDVLRATKQKRHRDGYEDGETVLRKVCSAADFVWSDIESLGSVTSIMFDDPASLPMREHPLTTEEVRTLCEDLRVLGEQDLKHLSKWRKLMRKALAPSETISNPKVEIECEREEDEDTRLVKELEELKETELRKTKREKRVLAKRQAKDKAREVLRMQSDAAEDGFADPELFSLTLIKCKRDVVLVDDNECDDGTAEVNSEADGNDLEAPENASTDMDSEEDRLRRDDEIEGLLEDHVKSYMARGERKTKRSKISYLDDCNLLERGEEDGMTHSAQDSDGDKGEDQVNPLIIPLETAPSQEEVVKTWFTQDVFVEPEEQEMLDKYHSEDEMLVVDEVTLISKSQTTGELLAPNLSKKRMDGSLQVPSSETPNDFEIVPVPPTYSSDSSSDESGVDIDRKAEILSVAKKLILKKQREARDLITADELSDDAAKETYDKVLGIIFSPVPFQSENLLSTLSSEQGADQRKSGLLWAALQAVSTSLLRHCFHPIDVKLLQDVDFHVLDWHQHKHILAFISGQHQVRIRDYEDSEGGSPCVLINDSQKDVRSLSWRPNGGRALAVACKGGICIWAASFLGNTASVRSGVTLGTLSRGSGTKWTLVDFLLSPEQEQITALSWSPNGKYLASASFESSSFIIWDVAQGVGTPIRRGLGGISLLRWSPSGDYFFSAKFDGTFYLWETNTWTSEPWSSTNGFVMGAAWDPDGSRILIAFSESSTLGSIHFATRPPSLDAHLIPVELSDIQSLTGSRGIDKIAWDASGERLALSYRDGNDLYRGLIAIYDVRRSPLISASLVGFIRGPGNDTKPIAFSFHDKFKQGPLLSVCWSSGYCCTYPLIFRSNVLP